MMARGSIQLDVTGVRGDADVIARRYVRRVTRRVLNRSAVLCPVDTGRLRASGTMSFRDTSRGPQGVVTYPVQYAAAVHDGSGPRIIRARRGRVLRFEVDGKVVFATRVRHPGTRARPFLRQAAQEVAAQEGAIFRRAGR